jgi:chromate transport protein ChrA
MSSDHLSAVFDYGTSAVSSKNWAAIASSLVAAYLVLKLAGPALKIVGFIVVVAWFLNWNKSEKESASVEPKTP